MEKLQCKDIPTTPILEHLAGLNGRCCSWISRDKYDIRNAMPDGFNLPRRLVLAKMDSLIRKGLVDGCACGCRGDFRLTIDGLAELANFG